MTGKNEILELTFTFSLELINYCELLEERKKYIIAKQLLRSGTSIGANVREAQNAESKVDFVHKLKIAAKEVEETAYWLDLCEKSPFYPYPENLAEHLIHIRRILNKIIITMKTR